MTRLVKRPKLKPLGDMKKFLDATKVESRLLGPIERHLLARPDDGSRRRDVLHPSAMCKDDWCHLAAYHDLMLTPYVAEKHNFALEKIFEEGHEIHRKWQAWLYEMGNLYGCYQCRGCGHREWGVSLAKCGECSSISLMYKEVPIIADKYRVHGHGDGWVKNLGDDVLIEIKSVGVGTVRREDPWLLTEHNNDLDAVWKGIVRPWNVHKKQAQLYCALLEQAYEEGNAPEPPPDEIVFIYEYKPNQQSKEFVVKRNPESVAPILDAALDVVYAAKKERPPPCPNSPELGCPQCQQFRESA